MRALQVEATLAAAAFAALCVIVLSIGGPKIAVEPDDGAYHYSIVAMTMGHFLTLSMPEIDALDAKVGGAQDQVPNQWVQVPGGRYISEKDPGYPFLAAPFEALGIIRWAQLFYAALACIGLFVGARRWLGRFGGLAAVGLYCSSGAAIVFAWRMYIETFTDASLVAAGSGALLWTVLATDVTVRRRTWAGLAGFVALELATFVRYTNIVFLGFAVAVVIAARTPWRALRWWLASVAIFGAGVAVFDDLVYGGPLTTGYQPGEITFAFAAIGPNLRRMPAHLLQAMPMLVLALAAIVWIVVRGRLARRDLWVGVALAGSWLAIWGLYSAYTWTVGDPMFTLPVVRFYVPALGAISLLGAWLVTRLPRRPWTAGLTTSTAIAALFVLGVWAFHAMCAAFGVTLSG